MEQRWHLPQQRLANAQVPGDQIPSQGVMASDPRHRKAVTSIFGHRFLLFSPFCPIRIIVTVCSQCALTHSKCFIGINSLNSHNNSMNRTWTISPHEGTVKSFREEVTFNWAMKDW